MTLSPRQLEIVVLVGRDGDSTEKIAYKLGIHVRTVETHMARIMERYPSSKRPRAALTELYYTVVANNDVESDDVAIHD